MSGLKEASPSIWKNGMFVRMFAAYSVSIMGNYFDMMALMILFGYVWKAEPMLIALIPVAIALPQALLSQFTGVLADKVDKVKLMMVSDLLTALLTLLLLAALHPGWALFIIAMRSVANVVHFPAQQGLIKQVVAEEHLLKAVSLNGMVMQLSKIIAPLLGGLIVSAASPQVCILMNAAAFSLSALILLNMLKQKRLESSRSLPEKPVPGEQKLTFWQSWRQGWAVIAQSRILWISFLTSSVGILFIQMIDVQYTTWLRETAPDRPEVMGWLFAASGFGAVVMMMCLNRFERLRGYGWLLGGSLVCIGAGFGGVGLLRSGFSVPLLLVYGTILGIGVALYSIGFPYIIQKHTSPDTVSRVSGISNSIASLCVVVAPPIGGLLVQMLGAGPVFVSVGALCTAIGILAIVFQKLLWREAAADFHTRLDQSS